MFDPGCRYEGLQFFDEGIIINQIMFYQEYLKKMSRKNQLILVKMQIHVHSFPQLLTLLQKSLIFTKIH